MSFKLLDWFGEATIREKTSEEQSGLVHRRCLVKEFCSGVGSLLLPVMLAPVGSG